MKNLYSRSNETSNRPKESSALYEVARNDSNKYTNLIHNGTQGLSEKREEMRLISSEAEILGNANCTENTILQLFIKPVAGHTYTINATPHDSITTIKSKIFDHDRIPPSLQRLVSSSKPLNEASTIFYVRLVHGCTIHVALRLLGGTPPPLPRPLASPVTATEIMAWSRRNTILTGAQRIPLRSRGPLGAAVLPTLHPAPQLRTAPPTTL